MINKEFSTILVDERNNIINITLNREKVRNAFNEDLINELIEVFNELKENKENKYLGKVLILTGKGTCFCAGADINWMKKMKDYTLEENYKDAYNLSKMLELLYTLPMVTIARVNGPAIGGGVGLVSTCDIAIGTKNAFFSFSEVKLGLVPACISPYLVKKILPTHLRYYFLTGKRFDAKIAKEIGLLFEVVENEKKLDEYISNLVESLSKCGPNALKMAKELLNKVLLMESKEYMEYTSKLIAELRISKEGQEGLSAFLEKRKPNWIK